MHAFILTKGIVTTDTDSYRLLSYLGSSSKTAINVTFRQESQEPRISFIIVFFLLLLMCSSVNFDFIFDALRDLLPLVNLLKGTKSNTPP